jgi:ribosomal protein L21E
MKKEKQKPKENKKMTIIRFLRNYKNGDKNLALLNESFELRMII